MTPAILADPPLKVALECDLDEPMLPIIVRRVDGREIRTERSPARHRAIHLGVLHTHTKGYVELAAGKRSGAGKLRIYTRQHPDHFLPGGGGGSSSSGGDVSWREPLLALAAEHHDKGDEVFVGMAPRIAKRAGKEEVHWSRCLWMDIDLPGHQQQVDALLARLPAHLEIESAGGASEAPEHRHRHLVWLLEQPVPARTVTDRNGREYVNAREVRQPQGPKGRLKLVGYRDPQTGRVITNASMIEWIERWNMRLIHHLGYITSNGGEQVTIADKLCQERARVLRLAGTRNGKTGRYARIVRLDLCLPPYPVQALVGELPDPPRSQPVRRRDLRSRKYDAYRLISTSVYFPLLAGIDPPAALGKIRCPSPTHEDKEASCSVSEYVWFCHACQAGGTIYDLASLMKGGPTRDALVASKEAFRIASEYVREQCTGALPATSTEPAPSETPTQ
jgi:hypothetical protein